MNSCKIIVIYHRADFDGLFSREIATRFLGDAAEYIGWDYGDKVPEIPSEADVIMIDISIAALMAHPRLTWIDHHKSAIDAYPASIAGSRIDGVAACRLAWQWFVAQESGHSVEPWKSVFIDRHVIEPLAVTLAGEYDVWDKRDPRAELFQHGLRSCEPDFARLLDDDIPYVESLLDAGRSLQFARERENASIIRGQGFTLRWEGLTFIACNAARFNSLLFTASLRDEHDGCLGFCWDGGKGRWKVSLYGRPGKPDIDFSAIAVRHGGGGHKQACGFECAVLPFDFSGAPSPALRDVLRERERQESKWGEQNHDPFTYLAILTEEVGELSQAALHTRYGGHAAAGLREEAVQVTAVALAILQCLDRGKWRWPLVQAETTPGDESISTGGAS